MAKVTISDKYCTVNPLKMSPSIGAALRDIVRQEFDSVGAHEAEKRVLPLLKVGPSKFEFHSCQLPL